MKKNKRVSYLEMQHSLRDTLEKNNIALDKLENWIHNVDDKLKYNEEDVELKEDLNVLKYIMFCMTYLDEQYSIAYKRVGGKL